jgi:LemA protein
MSFVPRVRRGAVSAGVAILIVCAVLLLVVGLALVGGYNGLAAQKESTAAQWAALDSQYKRRADLIPQLVETVKGAANFERSTLEAVVEARASVGKVQLPPDALSDPAALQRYLDAQTQLGGALSRLLVVAEQYPDLRASENYLSLQDQIEGTENRIAVARGDYIDAVRTYNTRTKTFPGNLIAGMFGFAALPQLEAATPAERAAPKIDFGATGTGK